MADPLWHDLGPASSFRGLPISAVNIGRTKIAVTFVNGEFGAISGVCNHAGGPLGRGRMEGEYVVCPWHNWKYHFSTGKGEPGYEEDAAPSYAVRLTADDRLEIDLDARTKRSRAPHALHPLARKVERTAGAVRVVGISTTNMDVANPRYSTSDALLDEALAGAATCGAETQRIALAELSFRACEGYYSKAARACTWPCSITQMDPGDQLDRVYEAFVHWADVILVATPIRWGNASSLYYRMVERMNCIQNQMTISNRMLMRNKTAAFIITGGQDNVQAVAGHMLGFFAEIGCQFPPLPYIAHSRGWSAEDMENNIAYVQRSDELREGARMLAARAVESARHLLEHADEPTARRLEKARGGRKAHGVETDGDGNIGTTGTDDVTPAAPSGRSQSPTG